MAGTVVAVFKDRLRAEDGAQALLDAGVPLGDISLVHKDAGGATGSPRNDGTQPRDLEEEHITRSVREVREHDVEQPVDPRGQLGPLVFTWGFIGASSGCLGAAMLTLIPAMGPILAAQPLMVQLAGAAIGTLIGGMIGAMAAGGNIPEKNAAHFHEHIQRGDTLVAVITSRDDSTKLEEILRKHGGQELGYFSRFIDTLQRIES